MPILLGLPNILERVTIFYMVILHRTLLIQDLATRFSNLLLTIMWQPKMANTCFPIKFHIGKLLHVPSLLRLLNIEEHKVIKMNLRLKRKLAVHIRDFFLRHRSLLPHLLREFETQQLIKIRQLPMLLHNANAMKCL